MPRTTFRYKVLVFLQCEKKQHVTSGGLVHASVFKTHNQPPVCQQIASNRLQTNVAALPGCFMASQHKRVSHTWSLPGNRQSCLVHINA